MDTTFQKETLSSMRNRCRLLYGSCIMADNDTFRYLGGLAYKYLFGVHVRLGVYDLGGNGPRTGRLGAILAAPEGPFSGHFWGHFWGPFLAPFWSTFGPQNGPQNGPKTAPKLHFFEVYFWTSFFEGFIALSGPFGSLLGSLEALLGGLWTQKPSKTGGFLRFLKMQLFGSLKLLMALLGSSCHLFGRSGPNMIPILVPKRLKKHTQICPSFLFFWPQKRPERSRAPKNLKKLMVF